jgi:hypothetical protein
MNEVEIFKIGTILHTANILPDNVCVTENYVIMVVCDAGEPFDSYAKILRESCEGEYSFMKAARSIVGRPNKLSIGQSDDLSIKGFPDGDPSIGLSYGISLSENRASVWRTSKVVRVIDDCLVITMNSVYAISDKAKDREKKLERIGIK